jgi:hypothetical protein
LDEYKRKKEMVENATEVVYSIEINDNGREERIVVPSVLNYVYPKNYFDAVNNHPDKEKWKESIADEFDSMKQLNVFEEAVLPPGRKAIDTRLVFKVKHNQLNQIARWKTRLVVKGFMQKEGIDYELIYSPTVGIVSIKLLLAIAAMLGYEIIQIDFKTAFLNAQLNVDIYVKIPDGWKVTNPAVNCLKLNRALYGLKQAPREWWLKLDKFLATLGYYSTPLDHCFYVKRVGADVIMLTIYVDDTIIVFPKE